MLPATVSSRNMLCCEELGRLFSIVFLRLIELWVTVYIKQGRFFPSFSSVFMHGAQKTLYFSGFSWDPPLGNHDVMLPATVSSRNMLCCEELGRLFSIVFLRLIELWVTVAYCKQKERSERWINQTKNWETLPYFFQVTPSQQPVQPHGRHAFWC